MSKKTSGSPMTPEEHRAALRAAQVGVPKSPEHCRNISLAKTGKPLTDEHRAAISRGMARHWAGHTQTKSLRTIGETKHQEMRLEGGKGFLRTFSAALIDRVKKVRGKAKPKSKNT